MDLEFLSFSIYLNKHLPQEERFHTGEDTETRLHKRQERMTTRYFSLFKVTINYLLEWESIINQYTKYARVNVYLVFRWVIARPCLWQTGRRGVTELQNVRLLHMQFQSWMYSQQLFALIIAKDKSILPQLFSFIRFFKLKSSQVNFLRGGSYSSSFHFP